MKSARIVMTPEFVLRDFPAGVRLVSARVDGYGYLELTVAHQDLPDSPADSLPPIATPSFRRNVPVEFLSWNVSTAEAL